MTPHNYLNTTRPLHARETRPAQKQYTDANGCDAGFNLWVPQNYAEAEWAVGAFDSSLTELKGVFKRTGGYQGEPVLDSTKSGWRSVNELYQAWFIRKTSISDTIFRDYTSGCWLGWQPDWGSDWEQGVGFNINDWNCNYVYKDYLCEACPGGRYKPAGSSGPNGFYCKECVAGKYSDAG